MNYFEFKKIIKKIDKIILKYNNDYNINDFDIIFSKNKNTCDIFLNKKNIILSIDNSNDIVFNVYL